MLIYCSPHNIQACAWEAEAGSSLSPRLTRATYIVNPYLKKKKSFGSRLGVKKHIWGLRKLKQEIGVRSRPASLPIRMA